MPNEQQNATPKKSTTQDIFIEEFARHGNVSLACRVARIYRSTLYRWKEKSDTFLIRYNFALEEAKDAIREEIYRRGKEGWDEDVYQLGKFAGTVRKYDTTLLIFHAKMLMPEYREKQQIEHVGKDGGPIEEKITIDPRSLSAEQLAELKRFALGLKGEHS